MSAQKKYEYTGKAKTYYGRTLKQIRALVSIAAFGVNVGDLGGWIENDENLDHSGDAWVYGNAWVSGNARVLRPITAATRSDSYTFTLVATPDGPRIIAGCRYFTFAEANKHWKKTRGHTMTTIPELTRQIEILRNRLGFSSADESAIKALNMHKRYLERVK